MALIFVPQYEVRFSSEAGSDITYEVDILRSYDDGGAVPSWVSNPVTPLVCTGNPVTIEYDRDYDVYKPIQGSVASLNLVIETAGQYDDFAGGSPYEWQLRVRYEDEDDNLQPLWCGYFTPLDTTEKVSTFPFTISYTATDGLGLLEQSTPGTANTDQAVNPFQTFVIPALQQVGLGLDVYVQSNIQLAGGTQDAILNATVSNFARWKDLEDDGELFTNKELVEGLISAFNCKITQAKGRWYIYNASTLSDSTTWTIFNSQGVSQGAAVEALVLDIDSTTSADLAPINDDLQVNLRRPYGSIECQPGPLVQKEFALDGTFDNAAGWSLPANNTSWANITGGKAILYRNFQSDNSILANPLLTNATGYPVDAEADITIKFDWEVEKRFSDEVQIYYRVHATFDAVDIDTVDTPTGYSSASYQSQYNSNYRNHNYRNTNSVSTVYWDSRNDRWTTSSNRAEFRTKTASVNEIINISHTISNPTTYSGLNGSKEYTNVRLYVTWYPLLSIDNGSRDGNGTTRVRVAIDNVSVKSMFESEVSDPTFERVQANYTTTLTYEPLFASNIPDGFYQRLTQENYKRAGKSESVILESIITQQKLNDFRNQFKYYEGSLLNLSSTPLSAINKINVNWSNYSETSNGIMNGGTFNLKKNTWDCAFYIPNQEAIPSIGQPADVVSQFYEQNVDLIPAQFPGRSEKVVYTLAFRVDSTDASNAVIENGLVPDVPFIQVVGTPGAVQVYNLNLIPLTGYIGVPGSTVVAPETDSTPVPENIVTGAFSNIQGNITLPITITIPDDSEFEELFINAQVLEFIPEEAPDVTPASVVITNSGSNLSGDATTTYDVSGIPGSTVHFTHHIKAAENFQLFSGNFDATYSDTSLSNTDAVDGMNSIAIDFSYHIPTTTESVSVTVTGNGTPIGTVGIDLFTRTVNFGTAPANTTFHEASNTFTGVPSATQDYYITLIPDADYQITSVAAPTLPSGVVANGAPYQVGENWEIPIQVTIPGSNDSVTITQGAIAVSEEPYALNFTVNNVGLDRAESDVTSRRITFDESDLSDSITPFVVTISAKDMVEFVNVDEVTVDIDEANVVVADGSVITLPESQFTAAKSLVDGNILITIAGNFPSSGGLYNLNINVLGLPSEAHATSGSNLTPRTLSIDNRNQTISGLITANGKWVIEDDADWLTVVNTDNQGARGGGVTVVATANTTGTHRIGTIRLVAGDIGDAGAILGGMTVTQLADSSVMSSGVTSIDVNIGGTAGSTPGVLYIT